MKKAFTQLHIAVLLAGFTGILGKLISLNEGALVWYRLLITSVTLWILTLATKQSYAVSSRNMIRIFFAGVIASLHWVSFYGSIKASNVSIGLLTFSAIGFFTALMEPVFFRKKTDPVELLLGCLVIAGIFFIFHFDPGYRKGILIGLISAFLGSLFPIMNRKILEQVAYRTVTLYELTGGWIFLTLLAPFFVKGSSFSNLLPAPADWVWLLVLSWFCTVLAFNLSMSALRSISAFTVNLTYNLEPVYGIALAFVVFREDQYFHKGFYLGFSLIIIAIILQMLRVWSMEKNTGKQLPSGQL
jgi:drug/metabolite transporter (DMT)-like permease